MSPPRRRRRAATILTAIFAALILGAGAAFAAVAALPTTNAVGSAGYGATSTNPAGFTDTQSVVAADQYGLTLKLDNAQGEALCDTGTGLQAAAGQVSTNLNTTYEVISVLGNPTGGCPNHGIAPGEVTFPGLATVPFGHHVWTDVNVIRKVKVIKFLVCVLVSKDNGQPVPTPSPSVTNPTASPTESVTQPTASPTESVTNPTATPTDTNSPTVNPVTPTPTPTKTHTYTPTPTPTGTDTASTTAKITRHHGSGDPAPTPAPDVTAPGGYQFGQLPGFILKCHLVVKRIVRASVLFSAQDLDAPTVTPLAGDLAGVQTRTVPLPAGAVFDSAVVGATGNLTALVPCSGGGFPLILAGPASYTSRACQPLNSTNHATATEGSGLAQGYDALNTSEVISPNASAATMAPNNSLSPTSVGPTGSASNASVGGSQFTVFSGNAPTS